MTSMPHSTLHKLALLSLGLATQQYEGTATRLKPKVITRLRAKLQEAGIELPLPLQPDADLNELDKFVAQLLADLTR